MDSRSKRRYINLQITFTIGMVVLGIVISAIVTGIFYLDLSNQVREDLKLRLRNIADIAALQLDPQELDSIVDKTDLTNPAYIKYQKELSDIINAHNSVLNIYTVEQNKEGIIYFYLDAGIPSYKPDPPGVIPYEQPTALLLATFASPSNTVVENNIYTDEFGTVISAYAPIYRRDGSLQSILGVDMNADIVAKVEQNARRQILIYFGLSIPLIILLAWIFGYRFSRPSAALTAVAARIALASGGDFETIPVSLAGNSKEAFDLIQIFNKMSSELQSLVQNLEQRVAERASKLESVNQQKINRAHQFEAISQVTRAITSIQDPDTLLPYVTQVISEQFGIYHTGIFLLDKEREFAVLRAANSDGGRKMLMRGHKLRVGQVGIVGFVAATGQPRIALDVGSDAVHFENPDLPDTHSEIALPLRYAGEIIGVLDAQSVEPNAFAQDDIEALLTLADQVSAVIRNTIAFEEIRNEIAEYQKSIGENARETWKVVRPKSLGLGFEYAKSKMRPLEKQLAGEDVQNAIAQNKSVLSNDESNSTLAVPIRLRGKAIGVVNLRANNNYKISPDDVDIVESVIERLSLAMETASLIQATQHRADMERVTTDISSMISSSSRFETILQTAAQELSRALGGSDVVVQIEPNAIELDMTG